MLWLPACLALVALLCWMFWRERTPVVTKPQPVSPLPVSPTPVAPLPVSPKPVPAPAGASQTVLKVFTAAGQAGAGGYADGVATQAQFRLPNAVAVDGAGNIFVADTRHKVT